MKTYLTTVLGLAVLCSAGLAAEPSASHLLQRLEEQNKKMAALMARVQELEAQQDSMRKAINEEIGRTDALAGKIGKGVEVPSWVQKSKISGDLRYRCERIDDESKDDVRIRHRIRARLQFAFKPCDDLDVYLRLASGGGNSDGSCVDWEGDPVSSNQTLGHFFTSKHVWLDLAYFDWHPNQMPGFHILGGKMKMPFHKPQKSQLLWDGDLNPEGLAFKYGTSPGETTHLFASMAGFWVKENGGGADNMLYGAQAGVTQEIGAAKLTVGGGYYNYTNIKGSGAYDFECDDNFFGNSNDGTSFTEDYQIAEAFVELGLKAGPLPLAIYGDFAKNTGASGGDDTGWLVGFNVGKCKAPGSWSFGYNYREVEADAVLGAFCDSDFGGGGTGHKGHVVSLGYQVTKCLQLGITCFRNDKHGANSAKDSVDYTRTQVDLKMKF